MDIQRLRGIVAAHYCLTREDVTAAAAERELHSMKLKKKSSSAGTHDKRLIEILETEGYMREGDQRAEYTEIFVTGEWLPEGTKIPAYWNGDLWNGWVTPQFTEAGIQSLAALMPDLIKFDAADGIVTVARDPDIEVKPGTILVDGQSHRVWSIDDWCWEREPEVPAISDDEVLVALMALGEDPTALRVKALSLRVASVSIAPDGDRVAAIQSAVDAARVDLSAEVARRDGTDLHGGNVEAERPVGDSLPDVGF